MIPDTIPEFRAWHKEKKKMIFLEKPEDMIEFSTDAWRMIRWDDNSGTLADNTNSILMQSVGRKDKNGKEIFEGDIVLFHTAKGGEVSFTVVWNDEGLNYNIWKPHGTESLKVIGNIYENPELLKLVS